MKKYIVNIAAVVVVAGVFFVFNRFDPSRKAAEELEKAKAEQKVLEAEQELQKQEMLQTQMLALYETQEVAGSEYRAQYAAEEGVTTLPSGLMYRVLQEGDGPSPAVDDRVATRYEGTLVNGNVFDAGQATFAVNGVIAGWTEALLKMSVGAKWELVIPPDLAYGKAGAPPKIPPGATLKFEVELLGIQ